MGEMVFKEGMRVRRNGYVGHVASVFAEGLTVRWEGGYERSFSFEDARRDLTILPPRDEMSVTTGAELADFASRPLNPDTINALVSALGANIPDEQHPLLAAIASLAQEADDLAELSSEKLPSLSSSLARLSVRIEAALKLAREYV